MKVKPRSASRDRVQVVLRASMSISPDASAVKRVLPVVEVYFTLVESPNTAAATAWHTEGSKPSQFPASSVSENPGTPVDTPHLTKPFCFQPPKFPPVAAASPPPV